MNTIRVEKYPSPQQLLELGVTSWPIWTKEISVFPWTYDDTETCYFLEGEVIVTPIGFTTLDVKIDSFDSNVFDPDTIAGGDGIFTLRLDPTGGSSSGITSVQNHVRGANDVLLMADGNMALTVPEVSTYMMMLMGIGMVGFMAVRRRRNTFAS